jgi:Lon protease-like protein
MNGGAWLAMFPLQTVLFPTAVLPLHVFEPRYRELTRRVLGDDREFGVTLIERGSEVGGGDVRVDVGTRARIVEAAELPDGRWALLTVGVSRIEVVRWLPDEPFPQAHVRDIPEPEPGPGVIRDRADAERWLRRALALRTELGEASPPATLELADDPMTAAFEIAAAAPIGPADAQRVLEAASAEERLRVLARLLEEEVHVLEARAAGG